MRVKSYSKSVVNIPDMCSIRLVLSVNILHVFFFIVGHILEDNTRKEHSREVSVVLEKYI